MIVQINYFDFFLINKLMDITLSKLWETVKDRWAWRSAIHEVRKSQHNWVNEQQQTKIKPRPLFAAVFTTCLLFVMVIVKHEIKMTILLIKLADKSPKKGGFSVQVSLVFLITIILFYHNINSWIHLFFIEYFSQIAR